ncbi:hypothetical protein D1AOALGA4SA_484 [Olavius algarvensis Delta 1 endosymbiont]|nr:hypothetical protein D1AOALGA4SA_484 [Olavius algarvensis Delta 1 endosymbiont]
MGSRNAEVGIIRLRIADCRLRNEQKKGRDLRIGKWEGLKK